MRYSRVLIALGLTVAVGLSVGLLARASQNRSAKSVPATVPGPLGLKRAVVVAPLGLKRAVQQELRQLMASRSRTVQPTLGARPAPATANQTCFVAGGSCSLTPCVIPVQSGSGRAVTAAAPVRPPPAARPSAAPVASSVVPATAVVVGPAAGPAPAVAVGPGVTSVVPTPPRLAPGQSCPSRQAAPQSLRVSTR